MKKCKLLFLSLLFFISYSSAQNGLYSPLIVNEVGIMPFSNEKYIELLVIGDTQNPENQVNLQDWIIDNNSDAFGQDSVYLSLGSAFSNVNPGSLILIYDSNNPHPAINMQNDGLPNSNGVYQLSFSNPAIQQCFKETGNYDCNGLSNSTYNWSSALPLNQFADVVQLRGPDQYLRQAVSWTDYYVENGNPRTTRITDGVNGVPTSIYIDKTCGYEVTKYEVSTSTSASTATPGVPNSDNNALLKQKLDDGGPVLSYISIDCEAMPASESELGSIKVTISGSAFPNLVVTWSGPINGNIAVSTPGTVVIPNLEIGTYTIKVYGDIFSSSVCFESCQTEVKLRTDFPVCLGECISIGEETPNPNYSYSWEPQSAFENPNISFQEYICPDEDVSYELKIFDSDCSLVEIRTYDLEVSEPKEIEIAVLPGDEGLCQYPVKLKATEGFQDYNWSEDVTGTGNLVTIMISGVHSVTATDENGCEAIAQITIDETNRAALAVQGMLKDKGAFELPLINITPALTGGGSTSSFTTLEYVLDNTGGDVIDILAAEGQLEVAAHMENFLSASYFSDYDDRTAYITNNLNICDADFESICTTLEGMELGFWAHIWNDPEDPSGNTGTLYVLGKSPNQQGFASISEYGQALIEQEYALSQPESLGSMDAEIFYIVQDQLADFYEAEWQLEDQRLKKYREPEYDPLLCGSIAFKNITALNGAGIQIHLGENTGVKYSRNEQLRFNRDVRALSGFYKDGKVYYAFGNSAGHTGFKSEKSGEYYPFSEPPSTVPMKITLGTIESPSGNINFECEYMLISEHEFSPSGLPDSNYPTGGGNYIPDFDNSVIGDIQPLSNVPYSDRKTIQFCVPDVKLTDFENGFVLVNNPTANAEQALFMQVQIANTATLWTWVYGVFKYDDPSEMIYHIWDCDYGGWAEYTPPEEVKDKMHFIEAMFRAVKEQGHSALDIGGLVPGFGEPFDVLNGLWYYAEGDFENGSMSMASVVAPFVLERISSNFIIVKNSDDIRVTNLHWDVYKKNLQDFQMNSEITVGQLKPMVDLMNKSTHLAGANLSIGEDCINYVVNTKGAYKAWQLLASMYPGKNAQKLWDIDLIKKVKELQADGNFLDRIGDEAALEKIIKANRRSPCATCATNPDSPTGAPWLDDIDVYLEDFRQFILSPHFDPPPTPGTEKLLNHAQTGYIYQIDAISQTIRYIKEGKIPPSIEKFEPNLVNSAGNNILDEADDVVSIVDNIGDVMVSLSPNLKLIELKSWKKKTFELLNGVGSTKRIKFANQLKAYFLQDISKVSDDLEYLFDTKKLVGPNSSFATKADAENYIKNWFQDVLEENVENWYGAFTSDTARDKFLEKFNLDPLNDTIDDLMDKIATLDPDVFSFIKVE